MGLLEDSEKIEVSLGFGCDMIHSTKETQDNGPCERKLSMEMKALGSVSYEKGKPERLVEPQGQAREFQVIQLSKENGVNCGDDVPVKSISEIQRLKLIIMTRQKLHVEKVKLESEASPSEARDLLVSL